MLSRRQKLWANLVFYSIAAGFIILLGRLGWIQGYEREKLIELANHNYKTEIKVPAKYGSIIDRRGRKLAVTVEVNSVFADPSRVEDKRATAKVVADVLGLNAENIERKLTRYSNRRFVWIKRRITSEEYAALKKRIKKDRELRKVDSKKISTRKLLGIGFRREYKRFYPLGETCGQLIGFRDIDGVALQGIERSLDSYLFKETENGSKFVERDGLRNIIETPERTFKSPEHGYSVILTIDSVIQTIVEEELKAACEEWQPKSGMSIVMNPNTGDILAMANWPPFDPNSPAKYNIDNSRNRAVTDTFEPGSTFKPFIMAAALQEGVVRPGTIINCHNGLFRIGGRLLHDHHSYGSLTASEILIKSSNIGMAIIGLSLGKERLYRYIRRFGFGRKTGSGIQGEVSGKITPLKRWSRAYTSPSVSMGHEISVTALQLITGFCSLVNGGIYLRPKIVLGLADCDGKKIYKLLLSPRKVCRVLSHRVSRRMLNSMLIGVVNEGTGKAAQLEEYQVGGKTGTAQKYLKSEGEFSHRKFVSSFVGYAPADAEKPAIVVLVTLNEPSAGQYYGGVVAAPAVGRIIRRTAHYIGIRPRVHTDSRDIKVSLVKPNAPLTPP